MPSWLGSIVGVMVGVKVSVFVGVGVLLGVGVMVGVSVIVGVSVMVDVGVMVGVTVIVDVEVIVGVNVGDDVMDGAPAGEGIAIAAATRRVEQVHTTLLSPPRIKSTHPFAVRGGKRRLI